MHLLKIVTFGFTLLWCFDFQIKFWLLYSNTYFPYQWSVFPAFTYQMQTPLLLSPIVRIYMHRNGCDDGLTFSCRDFFPTLGLALNSCNGVVENSFGKL